MTSWTTADMPDQTGRIIVITGATSGIGLEAARALSARGAELVLAVRDVVRGKALADELRAATPGAKISVSALDLASLASVRAFAAQETATLPRIDVLLNNAGLGMQVKRSETADGFERQFGTNHLGHFALTGLLMPALLRAPAPRVVTITSAMHAMGKMNFDDLQSAKTYKGTNAYSASKLANMMFTLELDRQARAQNSRLISVAAHPGISNTGFMKASGSSSLFVSAFGLLTNVIGQDAAHGALPGLYAATMPEVQGGQLWGPIGRFELKGTPGPGKIAPQAAIQADETRLWTLSENLTGVQYPSMAGSVAA